MTVLVKGVLGLFILAEAKHGVSGKALVERITKLTDGCWKPSFGSVYPLIEKMEREGLISEKKTPGKGKIYVLTAKGRKELQKRREKVMKESEEMGRTIFPLIMHAVHDFDESEIEDLKKHFGEFNKIRMGLLKVPVERRKQLVKKIIEFMGSELK
jgi:DNA-binding PadR family transcriptional regulator